jgi:hypothetical protein
MILAFCLLHLRVMRIVMRFRHSQGRVAPFLKMIFVSCSVLDISLLNAVFAIMSGLDRGRTAISILKRTGERKKLKD